MGKERRKKEERFCFYADETFLKAIEEYQIKHRIFNRSKALRLIIEEYLKKEGYLEDKKKE